MFKIGAGDSKELVHGDICWRGVKETLEEAIAFAREAFDEHGAGYAGVWEIGTGNWPFELYRA